VTGKRGRKCKKLLDEIKETKIMENEIGSSRVHSEDNSLWKSLWFLRKTDYVRNDHFVSQVLRRKRHISK